RVNLISPICGSRSEERRPDKVVPVVWFFDPSQGFGYFHRGFQAFYAARRGPPSASNVAEPKGWSGRHTVGAAAVSLSLTAVRELSCQKQRALCRGYIMYIRCLP